MLLPPELADAGGAAAVGGTPPGLPLWPPSLSASVMSGISIQAADPFHGSYFGSSMGASLGGRAGRVKRLFTDGHDSMPLPAAARAVLRMLCCTVVSPGLPRLAAPLVVF